jgi:predicted acylesterase/phospholipase RssA
MKKFIVLLSILLSIKATAQTSVVAVDTNSVCMPLEVARQVAADLVTGDSAKAMLSLTEFELDLTKQKLSYKDSLILNGRMKEINLLEQVRNEKFQKEYYVSLYNTSEKNYTALEKTFKRYKTKKTFTDMLFIGATSILTGTLIYIKVR